MMSIASFKEVSEAVVKRFADSPLGKLAAGKVFDKPASEYDKHLRITDTAKSTPQAAFALGKDVNYPAFREKMYFENERNIFSYEKIGAANCYAYAMGLLPDIGMRFAEKPQPGGLPFTNKEISVEPEEFKKMIINRAAADNEKRGHVFKEVGSSQHKPQEGNWLVALAYDRGVDYHWWKQNPDSGQWYHKPGITPIENVDGNGKLIFDPAICDRTSYDDFGFAIAKYDAFLGYYEVGPNRGGAA